MKHSLTKLTLILTATLFASILNADMPKHSFACHVITENQNVGVSFIQADEEKTAYAEAMNIKAHIDDEDTTEQPAAVMQCIILPGNKFNDYSAQKLLESIPR